MENGPLMIFPARNLHLFWGNHGYPKPGFQDQFEELSSIKAAVRIKVPALRVRRADIESMVKYQLRILAGEKSEHSMNMAMGQYL